MIEIILEAGEIPDKTPVRKIGENVIYLLRDFSKEGPSDLRYLVHSNGCVFIVTRNLKLVAQVEKDQLLEFLNGI